ncbi:class I SAM-dependent methyltransferase [Hoeflea sp. EC-HK425]|uniref:class I SAM-dependent methyltransferase n=1 Tax=Hoeflea sp. EC-HK425 TaxID=2038388 RepID=UPI00125ABE92|nr:class I SAM-dependent methyltransferase [Hoeflea sp. EC-HK425]VVT26382.1 Methyltransferase family protein [Hoeflea sp. EC-HK425]
MTRGTDEFTQANRLAWNASAPRHRQSEEWQRQLSGFADPSFSTLDSTVSAVLASNRVDGASVVQIGCNNGRETLSMLALGATHATGIDQSDAFISQAEELRAVSPYGARAGFVCADVYALPEGLEGRFDLALITIGLLNWMPDLPRFLKVAASLLVPGGRLVIYETHPVLDMFEPYAADPHTLRYSYFRTEPFITEEEIVYDGSATGKAPPSYWHFHTMGDIVTGCVKAGLQIVELKEYPHSNREVAYDIYLGNEAQLPLCYTLVAAKS